MSKIKMESVVNYGSARVMVDVDPYGRNPLEQDARQVITIKPKSPAPKMFSGGSSDLPAFTASGVDPSLLLQLPARCRHYAAALADPAELHSLFEQVAGDPLASIPHEGLDAAVARIRAWVLDLGEGN